LKAEEAVKQIEVRLRAKVTECEYLHRLLMNMGAFQDTLEDESTPLQT
jgi:hypothetical protein